MTFGELSVEEIQYLSEKEAYTMFRETGAMSLGNIDLVTVYRYLVRLDFQDKQVERIKVENELLKRLYRDELRSAGLPSLQ